MNWKSYRDLQAPDGAVREGIPEVDVTIVACGYKLMLTRVRRKPPQFFHVSLEGTENSHL